MAKKPTAAQQARIDMAVRTAAAHRSLGTSPVRDQTGNPYAKAAKRSAGSTGARAATRGAWKRDMKGRFA